MRIAIIGTGNVGGAIARGLKGKGDWQPLPCRFQHGEGNWRILGLADTARALREGRPYRASAEDALHVLEVMEKLVQSGGEGRRLAV